MKFTVQNKYGTTPNQLLNSSEISMGAKGIFGYLQAKPEGWSFSVSRITEEIKEGKKAVSNYLKELENNGYLQRIKTRGIAGRWEVEYILMIPSLSIPPLGYTVKGEIKKGIGKRNNIKASFGENEGNNSSDFSEEESISIEYKMLSSLIKKKDSLFSEKKIFSQGKLDKQLICSLFKKKYKNDIVYPFSVKEIITAIQDIDICISKYNLECNYSKRIVSSFIRLKGKDFKEILEENKGGILNECVIDEIWNYLWKD